MLSSELVASPIVLTSARGVRARAIAEHVIGVTLALARQLPLHARAAGDAHLGAGRDRNRGTVRTLHGKQLGIVGLGSIGAEVARLATGVRHARDRDPQARRRAASARRRRGASARAARRPAVAERRRRAVGGADCRDASARSNREALAHVKRGASLINIGRGRLVDDEAVVEALRDGRLGGAALDVFTREPLDPADSPYWDLPNVIVTPHVSGAMEDYWTPLVALFAENLRRFEKGEPLLNVVDKTAGY